MQRAQTDRNQTPARFRTQRRHPLTDDVSPYQPHREPDWVGRESHRNPDAYFWGQENGPNYYHPQRHNPRHSNGYGGRDDYFEYREMEPSDGAHDGPEPSSDVGHRPFDPDYAQWRREQMRALDKDYRDWRRSRYEKFADEFNAWRQNRPTASDADTDRSGSETPNRHET